MRTAIFMSLLTLLLLSAGCMKIDVTGGERPNLRLAVERFSGCDEMSEFTENRHQREKALKEIRRQRQKNDGLPSVAAQAGSGDAAAESFTNIQEAGVDEADRVKIAATLIYVSRVTGIEVIHRASLQRLGTLSTDGMLSVALFVDGDRLVALGQNNGGIEVRIFSGAAGALPTPAHTRSYPGALADSRFINGRLVLVTKNDLRHDEGELQVDGRGAVSGVQCGNFYKPAVDDFDNRHVTVISVDTRDPSKADSSIAILGGGDHLYMTNETLYLTKEGVYWPGAYDGSWQTLVVSKLEFSSTTGELKLAAVGAVRGRVKDQWAFHEYPDTHALALATTSWDESHQQNHLWMLSQNGESLDEVGAIHDFGTNEDIRAVRYVGNIAYVVTFQKTDPLFAFDLSNPAEPRKLGELKIPGFSLYLHPVEEGKLLGVGFDADEHVNFSLAQGVQVSLFDVSNPADLKRLDVKVSGTRGSASEVNWDHHAFQYDPATKTAAIPMVLQRSGNVVDFSGAIFYRIDGSSLTETARISHSDLMPASCRAQMNGWRFWMTSGQSYDINRVYRVDGKLLSVSRYGIRRHNPGSPATVISTTVFAAADENLLCGGEGYAN